MSRQANQKLRKRLVPKHSAHTKLKQSNPYSWEFKNRKYGENVVQTSKSRSWTVMRWKQDSPNGPG